MVRRYGNTISLIASSWNRLLDTIKLLKSRSHRLPGGWFEFPLRKLLVHVLLCTRVILVLVQCARIRVNLKGMSFGILSRFEEIHPSLFSKHFFYIWRLKPQESLSGGLPNSDFSSRLSDFILETCQKSVHGQTRQDVLSLLSLHSHHVFTSSYGCSYTGK